MVREIISLFGISYGGGITDSPCLRKSFNPNSSFLTAISLEKFPCWILIKRVVLLICHKEQTNYQEEQMKTKSKFQRQWILIGCISMLLVFLIGLPQAGAFVPLKGDLSKYDPNNITNPTGDTIKFAIWDSISGPNAYLGEAYTALLGFVAQDINSQGGIKVDGKMKKIQIIKLDTQSAPDPAKRALEKSILQDKLIGFSGVAGTHIAKIGQSLAKEYKTIFVNVCRLFR